MSQENLERMRRIAEDFLAGAGETEWEGWITGIAATMDPDIEWDAAALGVPGISGVRHGIEAVQQFWREWFDAWETLTFEYELLDAGDSVVMLLDQRMRGRSTGIEVSMGAYAQVATFREGLMVHWKLYSSQPEALEAVGLSE
jgi:ketosteroid isomerase-like protein